MKRIILFVFGFALVILGMTLMLRYWQETVAVFQGVVPAAIAVALFIAVIKASMVACCFMRLISERKLIYIILSITVIFFGSVMSISMSELHKSKIRGTVFVP